MWVTIVVVVLVFGFVGWMTWLFMNKRKHSPISGGSGSGSGGSGSGDKRPGNTY